RFQNVRRRSRRRPYGRHGREREDPGALLRTIRRRDEVREEERRVAREADIGTGPQANRGIQASEANRSEERSCAGSSTAPREALSVNGEAIVAFVSIGAAYTADPNDVWSPKNSFLLRDRFAIVLRIQADSSLGVFYVQGTVNVQGSDLFAASDR